MTEIAFTWSSPVAGAHRAATHDHLLHIVERARGVFDGMVGCQLEPLSRASHSRHTSLAAAKTWCETEARRRIANSTVGHPNYGAF